MEKGGNKKIIQANFYPYGREATKLKIFKWSDGIAVYLIEVNSNNEKIDALRKIKVLLSKELKISIITINRWLDDNKVHSTRSLKYPKAKFKSCLLA